MRNLFEISEKLVNSVDITHIRPQISWLLQNERMIGIKGSRGVGKTTLLLQFARKYLVDKEPFIYVSLDNLYFSENKFIDFADDYVKNGGKYLLVDEIHHYPGWSQELKNIFDTLPELKIIYTGSSLLHLLKGRSDLSRRSVTHNLPGLSLREYINITAKTEFPVFTLPEILRSHTILAKNVWNVVKPVQHFKDYIETGYYPFFLENRTNYHRKLGEVVLQVLENDMPLMAGVSRSNINKLKQLLYVISESAPFKPNIEKLSDRIGISRNTLKDYIYYLNEALLIASLTSGSKGISRLSKPDKIYLQNTNLMFAITGPSSDPGNLRETFFLNQVSVKHRIGYTQICDFMVDDQILFEIGGKNKSRRQIKGMENAFLAIDNIETGYLNEIPLWLFGFLY